MYVCCILYQYWNGFHSSSLAIDPMKRFERRDMLSLLTDSFTGNMYKRNEINYNRLNFPTSVGRRGAMTKDTLEWDLWLGGVVPYDLSAATPGQQNVILLGMKMLMEETAVTVDGEVIPCITFRPRTLEDKDYLEFTFEGWGDSRSRIGSNWGASSINLSPFGCLYPSTAVHELMHTLGFTHEMARPDRDQYIKINYDNICPGYESNFRKISEEDFADLGTPYDINSILQYSRYAFSNTAGRPTIIELPRTDPIPPSSNFRGLSPIDVKEARRVYQCKR